MRIGLGIINSYAILLYFLKQLLVASSCFFCSPSSNAQQVINIGGGSTSSPPDNKHLKKGDVVPNLSLGGLLNAPEASVQLSSLKGKLVILEFWATWCGPCLPAMEHLDKIKRAFPGQVEVIAVSDESAERISRYTRNKPSSLWFHSDPVHSLRQYFPYHAIPHTVVIDKQGRLVANTSPGELTEKNIATLLIEGTISVTEKNDAAAGFDMMKDYFPKPAGFNQYSFEVQPLIPGGFPITRRFAGKSEWFGRRITILNSQVSIIFRNAFNVTSARTVYEGVEASEFDHRTTKDLYCMDVIVPLGKEKELNTYFQQQLLALDLKYGCRLEKRKMLSVVITCTDPSRLEGMGSTEGEAPAAAGTSVIRATSYDRKQVPLDDLFRHFENFGLLKEPVTNETGIQGNFDLHFEFDAEDKHSFSNELAKLGLKAEKKEREVEVLVIYKKN